MTAPNPAKVLEGREWRKDCETCDGEGKFEHPHMPTHDLRSVAPSYAIVECDDCGGTGAVWTDEPVSLADAPVGLFWCGETLALKTEYGNNEGRIDAYIVSSGEFFWGAAPQSIASQRSTMVMPIDYDAACSHLRARAQAPQ